MNPALQDTLLQLFEHVHHNPDSLPAVPVEEWDEGSTERQLLISFSIMMEQVKQRVLQLRRAEEQLREREEQYRAVFEATTDGLSINDLEDGRVIEANPALCEMFGYSYEEFINLPPTATIHPDTYHVVDEVLQKVQTGSQFQTHFVALRKDGTAFNAEERGTPFIYKGRPHLLGSIRDITEQVQAEEQLREREEQYRSIFEATSDALLIGDLEDGHVVEVNPAACQMYGYSYEEFIGLAADAITHPDSLSLLPEALQTIREGHQLHVQGLGLRKDGIPFHVEARGTPFTYKGTPHLLTVAHEITDRVEAEQKLREREEQYREAPCSLA
jgi:PAS domain S-box-containing protein